LFKVWWSYYKFLLALVDALNNAIHLRKQRLHFDPHQAHQLVASMYNWRDIARRTELIYDEVNSCRNLSDPERMSRYMKFGEYNEFSK
jgi:phosphatidylinositol glycan class A protein